MELKIKEIIRDIKLHELGIKDKPDGYDNIMSLRGLKPFKVEEKSNVIYYGKANDIKFGYYNYGRGYIYIKKEVWDSIEDSFNLSYIEVQELTMWSIGNDPNLKGISTQKGDTHFLFDIGNDPNLKGISTMYGPINWD